MKRNIIVFLSLFIFFLFISMPSLVAQSTRDSIAYAKAVSINTISESGIEFNGLVVDETRTRAGHDFFDYFFKEWDSEIYKADFIITIREEIFRQNRTKVYVKVNDKKVFETLVQSSEDFLKEMSVYAKYKCHYEVRRLELGITDFEDEMSGNGLF
ncbi:MAG: CsgE family curli-type amyloid fiber assembly protein [Bacteroidales bacterium]